MYVSNLVTPLLLLYRGSITAGTIWDISYKITSANFTGPGAGIRGPWLGAPSVSGQIARLGAVDPEFDRPGPGVVWHAVKDHVSDKYLREKRYHVSRETSFLVN